MTRPILIPADAANGQWPERSFRELHPKIRKFGYVPDAQALLPGDVLLVTDAGLVPRLIRTAQERGGFHPDHSRWTHAALYIGRGQVVEATVFGGVCLGSLASTTFQRDLLVRRHPDPTALSMELRYHIVVDALASLHRGYSLSAVPRLAWQAWRHRLWEPDRRPDVRRVTICSTLVRSSYATAIRTDLTPGVIGASWPADLSETTQLEDVQIGWVKVVP